MKKLIFILFISLQAQAIERIQLENTFNLFSQKLGPDFTLPVPLSDRIKLTAEFELPAAEGPQLRKMFSQNFEFNEFKTVFEIYFFDQNGLRYLSQQVFFYKNSQLVTRCTAYFGLEQKFLVPGSCAGVVDGELLGVAIYK